MTRKLKRSIVKGDLIDKEELVQMLKQCHLGGALEECILDLNKGTGTIRAIDITNTITIFIEAEVAEDVTVELGLGNIELLIKFLTSIHEEKILFSTEDDKQYLEIKREDSKRRLRYLLTTPDVIVTKMEGSSNKPFKKLERKMEYETELSSDAIRDFLSYSGLLKEKGTMLRLYNVKKKQQLSLFYGDTVEHQFEVVLDKDFNGDDNEFDIGINGDFVAKIFGVIDYDEDDPPILSFTNPEMPILIKDKNAMWFITPIVEIPF